MDLLLFSLVKENTSYGVLAVGGQTSIAFYVANPPGLAEAGIPHTMAEKPFPEFYHKQLRVQLGAKKGRVPVQYVKSIRSIIEEARTEGGND
jgi:hypothetical protein